MRIGFAGGSMIGPCYLVAAGTRRPDTAGRASRWMELEPTGTYTQKADTTTTLHDFVIQGAAEIGECSGAQSFRATHRQAGRSVLLHKFRPAESLTRLRPLVEEGGLPDFSRPFVTRFTHLFVVAGSAYLVEPVPLCSRLREVWRYALQERRGRSLAVVTVLIRQMLSITHGLVHRNRRHGALDLDNIVLASTGCFGVLTAHLECEEGLLWLRKDPDRPARPDFYCLVDILNSLLDMDAEIAAIRKTPLQLPKDVHRRIRNLSHALERDEWSQRSRTRC